MLVFEVRQTQCSTGFEVSISCSISFCFLYNSLLVSSRRLNIKSWPDAFATRKALLTILTYYQALKKQVRDGEEGEYLDEEYPKREDLEITVWNKRLASIN
jgi:hypothetical protein